MTSSKYSAIVYKPLADAIRIQQIDSPYNFENSNTAKIQVLETKEEYENVFGMLIADVLGAMAERFRVKPVCTIEGLLKTRGTQHVLLINEDDYGNVPDRLKEYTVPSNYVTKGLMYRILPKLNSGYFSYGGLRVITDSDDPLHVKVHMKYEFDISKYYIEVYPI